MEKGKKTLHTALPQVYYNSQQPVLKVFTTLRAMELHCNSS